MVTEKNIDAIVRTFFDEWAHPMSYVGGNVDETSGKYEDRLNAGRIRGLYAFEANIDWDGADVDMTPAGLDAAIKTRVPFIANGYAVTTQDREDGTTAVDIKGWITQDASCPFQDYASYVPQAGERPFAERLIIDKNGLIRDDLFRSGVARIETPAPAVVVAPSQEAPLLAAEAAPSLSAKEAYPKVDEFLRQLYATGARYVSIGGETAADRRVYTNPAFSAFFVNGPALFWGKPHQSTEISGGVASPFSYTLVDWKILDEREGHPTVQTRIQSFTSMTSQAAYYQDTFTLVRNDNDSRYKVSDQQREQIPAFRVF